MNSGPELELWRDAWKASTPTQPRASFDLRIEQQKQAQKLRIQYVGGLSFALLLIAFPGWMLHANYSRETLVWAVVVWAATLAATAFQVWNWRETWKVPGHSVLEHAALYERRCQAIVRAARFGYGFLALQLAIAVPWLTWDYLRRASTGQSYAKAIGFLAILSAAFLVQFSRSRRQARAQIRKIEEFRRAFRDENAS